MKETEWGRTKGTHSESNGYESPVQNLALDTLVWGSLILAQLPFVSGFEKRAHFAQNAKI